MTRGMTMIFMLTVLAGAADEPTSQRGRQLFTGNTLGTNGKSCASCHPDRKGLEQAAGYRSGRLEEIINRCITEPLEGRALEPGSVEMKSLILYIKKPHKSRKMHSTKALV